jgi:hypothetical protein
MIDCKQLAAIAHLSAPASLEAIRAAEVTYGTAFPHAYVELLRCSDGLALRQDRLPAAMLRYQITFCAAAAIVPQNQMYKTQIYLPDLLWIGYSGLREGVFLDCRKHIGRVSICRLDKLATKHLIAVADNLATWVNNEFHLDDQLPIHRPANVDVYLVRQPANGAASLRQLQVALSLPFTIDRLLSALSQLPFRLFRAVDYLSASWRCSLFNKNVDTCLGFCEVDRLDRPVPIEMDL